MNTETVPDEFGVEYYVNKFRRNGEDSGNLYARTVGAIEGTLGDVRIDDTERCRQIRNVIAAADVVLADLRCPDDPTPATPAGGDAPHVVAMTDGGLVDETPNEAPTLWAAIRFSDAQREALRAAGRITRERLRAATLDLLHGQALDEDAERAQRADLRPGEQGRVTNPDLARFLAGKEDERRGSAPAKPVCVYETGGGSLLRRRCGAGIWLDTSAGPDGTWKHIGNTWFDHVAFAPISEAR